MLLQVGGEDGLDDEEAKALELHMVQVGQEVELRLGQEETPRCRGMVVLQDRAVVIQHSLWGEEGRNRSHKERLLNLFPKYLGILSLLSLLSHSS